MLVTTNDRLGSPGDICIIIHLLVEFALQSENIRAPGRVRCFKLRIRERLMASWRRGVEESARSLLPCLNPQLRLNWPGGDTLEHVVGRMSRCTLQSHILNADVPQHCNHTTRPTCTGIGIGDVIVATRRAEQQQNDSLALQTSRLHNASHLAL